MKDNVTLQKKKKSGLKLANGNQFHIKNVDKIRVIFGRYVMKILLY